MEKEILYLLSYQAHFNPCAYTNFFFNKSARKQLFTAPIKVVLADGVTLLAKAILEVIGQRQNISLDGFEFDGPSLSDWYNGSNADVVGKMTLDLDQLAGIFNRFIDISTKELTLH